MESSGSVELRENADLQDFHAQRLKYGKIGGMELW